MEEEAKLIEKEDNGKMIIVEERILFPVAYDLMMNGKRPVYVEFNLSDKDKLLLTLIDKESSLSPKKLPKIVLDQYPLNLKLPYAIGA